MYLDLIFNLALLVALSVVSGFIEQRWPRHTRLGILLQGALFGGTAVLGMLRPLNLEPGLFFDGRSVMVSVCALFYGPWAAVTAVIMTILCRIGLGGTGITPGVMVILSSAGIGLLVHFHFKRESRVYSVWHLYVFGVVVHLAMLAMMFTLPVDTAITVVRHISLPVLLLYPLATLLVGKILMDQEFNLRFIDELQRARQQLDITLQSLGEAVISTNREGRVVFMNPVAETLTGWSCGEAQDKPLAEIFHIVNNQTRQTVNTTVDKVLREGVVVTLTNHIVLVARDGKEYHIAENAAPMHDADGNIHGAVLVFREVTAEYKAREELRASELLFRNLFEHHAAVKLIVDPQTGTITEANHAAELFYGWSRAQLHRRTLYEISILSPEQIKGDIDKAASGEQIHHESRHRMADGSLRDVEVFSSTIEVRGKMLLHSIVHDITNRKKAEEALRASENYLGSIFRAAPTGIGVVSNRIILTVNDRLCAMTGYAREELLGKNSRMLYVSDTEHALVGMEKYPQISSYGTGTVETRWQRKDGQCIDVLMSSTPINPQDLAMGVTFTALDITERKLTEMEIMEQRKLFETMFNAITDSIIITNADRQIQLANKGMESTFGYKPEELYGRTTEVFYADHRNYQESGQVVFNDEAISSTDLYVTSYKDKYGRIFPGETFGTRLYDNKNQWIGNLGILRDITKRKQDEADLERLKVAIEQVGEVIVITDTMGNIQYANPAFEQVTGYSLGEVYNQNPRILKSGVHDETFYNDLWQTVTSGRTWTGRMVNKHKSGSLYTEDATITPVFDAKGDIVNYVAVKRDITSHLKLEAQFLQAQKMDSVGRLTGGVAHDFNNILSVIMGYTEMALERVDPAQRVHADLEKIYEAATRSVDIVRQLLAFSRQQPIAPKVLDLNDTVEGMFKMLRRLIGEDLDLVWTPTLGQSRINMDPAQIDQILVNLCVNARDAINGIGRITIETHCVTLDEGYQANNTDCLPGEYLVLCVSDTGCGMDREIVDKIFEPFFTTKGVGFGTGLGLATVYGIVKQNLGFINVYSELGTGTTFKIYLPCHKDKDTVLWEKEEKIECPRMSRGETLLLVEDDPTILAMVLTMLESLNYRVLTADSPKAALRCAEEHIGTIDLLITDVIMPEMNGKELATRLLALCPKLKLLYMSGYTSNVIAHHGVLDEGVHFLQKPFSKIDLSARIREVLDGHESTI